jgi:hypothetical protein
MVNHIGFTTINPTWFMVSDCGFQMGKISGCLAVPNLNFNLAFWGFDGKTPAREAAEDGRKKAKGKRRKEKVKRVSGYKGNSPERDS